MDFPIQNIPLVKKDKEWHMGNVNAVLTHHKGHQPFIDSRKKDHENYLLVAGEFDHKQFEYVTDMYGLTSPARLVNFPMMMPKLDLLAGELISQPLQFSVNVVGRNNVRKKNEEKITLASEVLLRPIRREIESVLGMPIPDEDVGQEVPEDIERYSKLKFRNAIEEEVHIGLTYCIQKHKLKDIFKRGFYDLGITGKEFYKTYIKNGDPFVERLDPRSMIYDIDSDKESLKDSKYAGTDNWYTVNEIVDRFGPELTKTDITNLEKLQSSGLSGMDSTNYDSYSDVGSKQLKVRVVELQWRSIRMIKYKVSPNPYDSENPHYKKVADTYKAKKGEKIIERPLTEIRKATKIGHEILVGWGLKPNQMRFEENYADTSLDFHGIIRNNFNGSTLSVVDALKNIQILYNIVMYQIELAMSRAGGKAMVYDVSQKPKGIELEDVFYHAKNTGLILINGKQEGMQSSNFNQFTQVDFTLSQSVSQMINLKMMLEDTADKLTGISASRAGINKTSDAVGTNERSVMQSTLITAPLFDIHYSLVGDVFNSLASLMGPAWGKEGRMANIFGDTGMQTFKINKASCLAEMGIFVENSGKEVKRKQDLMMLLERYASTGNFDPKSAIKAVNAESSSEVESILITGLEAVEAVTNQLKERETAAMEAKNEIDARKIEVPLEVAKINSETDIQVKEMEITGKIQQQETDLMHKEDMQQEERVAGLDSIMLQEQEGNGNGNEK
jgi:hypothetical protein